MNRRLEDADRSKELLQDRILQLEDLLKGKSEELQVRGDREGRGWPQRDLGEVALGQSVWGTRIRRCWEAKSRAGTSPFPRSTCRPL